MVFISDYEILCSPINGDFKNEIFNYENINILNFNNESDYKYNDLIFYVLDKYKKRNPNLISSEKTIFIFSTTKGNINLLKTNPNDENLYLWKISEQIHEKYNLKNKALVISNACISGTLTIIAAKNLIESGKYDNAVVIGADISSEFITSGFDAFKAIDPNGCKPFDKEREGMVPGEGAGLIVLTNNEKFALEPHIIVTAGVSSNDANHISAPSRTGEGLFNSIQYAMNEANVTSSEIDCISAHGTGTIYNDESEAKAIHLADLQNVPTSSMKGLIGHTFGAAGIIETIIGIISLCENRLFKSEGYKSQGTEKPLNIITENTDKQIHTFLKTASGFGGSNAALIVQKKSGAEIIKKKYSHTELKTLSSINIENGKIFHNNKLIFEKSTDETKSFYKEAYKHLKIKYPKFYKMDELCKLAIIASEVLLKNINYNPEKTGFVLSNGSSSLITDFKHQQTINDSENYFPSPAIFVYTLANIMIGEIAVKHEIKGENILFIEENFNENLTQEYTQILFNKRKTEHCITGRIEVNYPKGEYFVDLKFLSQINN